MSHIRPDKVTIEVCHTCNRGGWKKTHYKSVLTSAEYKQMMGEKYPLEVEGLPKGYEAMSVLSWEVTIYLAVKEAIEYVTEYDIPGAGFEFNDKLILVTPTSDPDKVVRKWWKEMYNETPEESWARR